MRFLKVLELGLNRFNLIFWGRDYFLVLHGVVVESLGHLGEVFGDEVEDVRCHSVLGFSFRELLKALEERLTE